MAKRLLDPSIEVKVSNRVHMTPNTIDRVGKLAKKWRWGKAETYEFLLRCALVAHEEKG